ncbi:hypothetical protein ACH5RR_018801 [Cinchona calisaya]|uniref:Uncharacterized protein n=1 Tax=Cinchona calisaya TaxID=153742 RepID=A0ABD2ZR66_9GENT
MEIRKDNLMQIEWMENEQGKNILNDEPGIYRNTEVVNDIVMKEEKENVDGEISVKRGQNVRKVRILSKRLRQKLKELDGNSLPMNLPEKRRAEKEVGEDKKGEKEWWGNLVKKMKGSNDDSPLFCKADVNEAKHIKRLLEKYEETSRQEVNYTKSVVFCSRNCDARLRHKICQELGEIKEACNAKYLGLPLLLIGNKKEMVNKENRATGQGKA